MNFIKNLPRMAHMFDSIWFILTIWLRLPTSSHSKQFICIEVNQYPHQGGGCTIWIARISCFLPQNLFYLQVLEEVPRGFRYLISFYYLLPVADWWSGWADHSDTWGYIVCLCVEFWWKLGYLSSFSRVLLQKQLSLQHWDASLWATLWEEMLDFNCFKFGWSASS